MSDLLPKELAEWSKIAEGAGFQNWEQVVAMFVQASPTGAEQLLNFLQEQAREVQKRVQDQQVDSKASAHLHQLSESKASERSPGVERTVDAVSSHLTPKKRINIGGTTAKDGWCIFNALKLPDVDVVGLSTDLSHWESNSVEEVYSSHCFEHLGYQRELLVSLKEVLRVLVPGGSFKCSVPNLEVLCHLYLNTPPDDPAFSRFAIMRMIYGGQTDDFDFHKVGFDFSTMRAFMLEAGFESVVQVPQFDLFQDTSCLAWHGTPISLNLIAYKSRGPESGRSAR